MNALINAAQGLYIVLMVTVPVLVLVIPILWFIWYRRRQRLRAVEYRQAEVKRVVDMGHTSAYAEQTYNVKMAGIKAKTTSVTSIVVLVLCAVLLFVFPPASLFLFVCLLIAWARGAKSASKDVQQANAELIREKAKLDSMAP